MKASVPVGPKKGLAPTRRSDFRELLHGEALPTPDRPFASAVDGAIAPPRFRPERRRRDDGNRDREPEAERPHRIIPDTSLPFPIREAGPPHQSASTAAVTATAGTDPRTITEIAEKVLRTLRVGADAFGRRVVQLQIGAGALAGAWIELRRESGGVRLQMREATGRDHPDLGALETALRARGIQML